MKIALFSDIHANLPALEAFLEDVEKKQPDSLYCLGDLVGYNIWPNEVIEEIRKRKIPAIAGNYDWGIGQAGNDCGCAYKSTAEKANGAISIAFTNEMIKPEQRKYLQSLPAHIRIEFQFNNQQLSLLLVHGSPRRINEYLFEDRDDKSMLRIMEKAGADILCFGHTHQPYHKIIRTEKANQPHYRHAVNTGSVGKPKDKDIRGCYVMITLNEFSSVWNPHSIQVEFIRFNYDVERAARGIETSILPNEYALNLRRGY
ncbi:metallophosphoesterase family protein [Gynurincola endophyticus]|uniref:metallophosphoesterase family protein n=1 Tax=Gynurincola endophyticus TaxID=2479004 RepID=UPI000F8F08C1|nr:metallophosphoesterase family protein [Gynurincola endophyticus]